jgi:hypothetical protein
LEPDIGHDAREIVRRLSQVELAADVRLDRPRVEVALNEFLSRLGLAPRPVRWAGGPHAAFGLLGSLKGHHSRGIVSRALGDAAKRPGKVTRQTKAYEAARAAAAEAVNARVWTAVQGGYTRAYVGDISADTDWVRRRERSEAVEWLWELSRAAYNDAEWCAAETARMYGTEYYDAYREFAAVRLPLVEAYEAGLWKYWVASEEMLAAPRPRVRLREGRLHGDGVSAVLWESGESLHFLNGVLVPERVALTPARELDSRLVVETRNAEVRREIVRKIGVERVVTELGAVCVDRSGDYELLMLDLGDRRRRPFLKMKNPSVPGVYHVEGVHPDCSTVREALAWRNGTDTPPSVLT